MYTITICADVRPGGSIQEIKERFFALGKQMREEGHVVHTLRLKDGVRPADLLLEPIAAPVPAAPVAAPPAAENGLTAGAEEDETLSEVEGGTVEGETSSAPVPSETAASAPAAEESSAAPEVSQEGLAEAGEDPAVPEPEPAPVPTPTLKKSEF